VLHHLVLCSKLPKGTVEGAARDKQRLKLSTEKDGGREVRKGVD
jgi:hypothetical protein